MASRHHATAAGVRGAFIAMALLLFTTGLIMRRHYGTPDRRLHLLKATARRCTTVVRYARQGRGIALSMTAAASFIGGLASS